MGRVYSVDSSATKESQRDNISVQQQQQQLSAAPRPLTDRQEASSIELSSSQRCSSLESLSTEGAGTNTLSHYNPQAYQDPSHSVAQHVLCAPGSSELSGNKGTFVLSHYTEYHVSDQTFVVDVETRCSKASLFVSSRLSHPPGPSNSVPSSSGYSARAAGPPPLEHLPNYYTLDADLNSSSNNSARSLPPPLLCPSAEGGESSVPAAGASNPLVCMPPPPLQLIPLATPSLLKPEPIGSSSIHADSDAALWKPLCSTDSSHLMPAASGTTSSVSMSCSPPPLTHPPVSLQTTSATGSSHSLFPQPTSIVLYGPPQGML